MRINYSQDADAIYIRLRENPVADTDAITDDIIMDYDDAGNVVAIEILSASSKVDIREMIVQAFDKVMVERPAKV